MWKLPLMLCDNHQCHLKLTHSIITCHSLSSHKITISRHPNSLKSCAMAQIWMLHDDPSASTTSSSNQVTLSSWSIYHHAKPTSSLTISDSTWSDQGNDGKKRQWYRSVLRRIRVVKSYNGPKGWCHVRLKMDKSTKSGYGYGYGATLIRRWNGLQSWTL